MMPLAEAKTRLSEVADSVYRTHDRVAVTRNGRDYVTLVATADLESLLATIELLGDPAAMARVAQAKDDIDNGRYTSQADMSAVMAQRGSHGA